MIRSDWSRKVSNPLVEDAVGARQVLGDASALSGSGSEVAAAREKQTKSKGAATAHLKAVPQDRSVRAQIREEAARAMEGCDRSAPLAKEDLIREAQSLLVRLGLDAVSYLGFTMVALSNEFWRDQLMAVDFDRRLLLLPHCLKPEEDCPGEYDEFGLNCTACGECRISDFKVTAEELGYKVLIAEGTPVVLKVIVSGYVDAIVGVACLNVLEKAIDKVLGVGVPSMAVPLLSNDCKNTSVDEDWVSEIIGLKAERPKVRTRTYVPLLRAANGIFEEENLERLAPQPRRAALATAVRDERDQGSTNGRLSAAAMADPVASTEAIAFDFLTRGGKRSRPFITLAVHDALTGGNGTDPAATDDGLELPDEILRAALAIEVFHKASLIHDDIEDGDTYRYGVETLHRKHGIPVALNVGDYLIGQGYQIVAGARAAMGPECASDILGHLSESHVKLSEGQGAELAWRNATDKSFTPLEALRIYALKTAPAFEAALYAGARLAGSAQAYERTIVDFSRNLGIAFQILNDLKDWDQDDGNKRIAGGDVLCARPTLLLAIAQEAARADDRRALLNILSSQSRSEERIEEVRGIYRRCGAFDKAEALVEKYRGRAEAAVEGVEPQTFADLLHFLVDNVLQREEPDHSEFIVSLPMLNRS